MKDDLAGPKSYNWSTDVSVGGKQAGDLLLLEGPTAIACYDFPKRF